MEVDRKSTPINDSAESSRQARATPTSSESSSRRGRGKHAGTGDLPRTPRSPTENSDIASGSKRTPLTIELAKMADRCGGLLNEYFHKDDPGFSGKPVHHSFDERPKVGMTRDADVSPSKGKGTAKSVSPIPPTYASPASTSTQIASSPPLETLPRYRQLPVGIQDKVLSEALAAEVPKPPLDVCMQASKPLPPQ